MSHGAVLDFEFSAVVALIDSTSGVEGDARCIRILKS
jgi:hypothetical protein